MMVGKELYKKSVTKGSPLRVSVLDKEGRVIASSIHQGGGGAHQGARNVVRQIERQGEIHICCCQLFH